MAVFGVALRATISGLRIETVELITEAVIRKANIPIETEYRFEMLGTQDLNILIEMETEEVSEVRERLFALLIDHCVYVSDVYKRQEFPTLGHYRRKHNVPV